MPENTPDADEGSRQGGRQQPHRDADTDQGGDTHLRETKRRRGYDSGDTRDTLSKMETLSDQGGMSSSYSQRPKNDTKSLVDQGGTPPTESDNKASSSSDTTATKSKVTYAGILAELQEPMQNFREAYASLIDAINKNRTKFRLN